MATWLKQSTAAEIKLGPFVDETDGKTAETALTISQADVRLAKNGGDWAQKNESTTMAHEEAGWYRCLLDTTDTNTLGILIVAVHESGALPVWREFLVVAANIYDSLLGGGDVLDVSVVQWLGTAAATPTVAGVPEVDVTHVGGSATTATLDTIKAETASIQTDTNDIQTRLPAALVGGRIDASIGAVAAGAIAAAAFAAGALDAVWSTATRLLTAGTNIVLAKGTGVTGFNDLSAAQVNAEADTALADVGVTTTVTGRIDATIGSRATQTSVDDLPTNAELATALAAADDAILAAIAALNNLSAAGVRSAVGLASANLDTQLGDLPTNAELATALAAADDAVLAAIAALSIPTANQNADALFLRTDGIETGVNLRAGLRLMLAALAGKLSGAATNTVTIRDTADSKNRIVATTDADGNRSAVTLDPS